MTFHDDFIVFGKHGTKQQHFIQECWHGEKDLGDQDTSHVGEIDIEESFTEGFEMMVTEEDMVEHFDLTMTDMDDHWGMEDNFTQARYSTWVQM